MDSSKGIFISPLLDTPIISSSSFTNFNQAFDA